MKNNLYHFYQKTAHGDLKHIDSFFAPTIRGAKNQFARSYYSYKSKIIYAVKVDDIKVINTPK